MNFILSTSICIIIGTEVLFCQNKFNYRFNDFVYDLCIGGINISVTRVATNYVNFLWNFSTVEYVVPRSPSPIISTRTFNREIRIKLRLQRECFFFLNEASSAKLWDKCSSRHLRPLSLRESICLICSCRVC